jgi:hypothetical protein
VLFGDVAAFPDIFVRVRARQRIWILEAPASLGAGGNTDDLVAVTVPPVAIVFMRNEGHSIFKLVIGSTRPQIEWLKDMIVGRYDPVCSHI